MQKTQVSDFKKMLFIIVSGFTTLIMLPFVKDEGGDKMLIFVVTVPFHIVVSCIMALIYSKVFVRRKVDWFYKNAYVLISVFLLVISAVIAYPYAR